jgi:2-polyprenyl-3-methyl-5-hydroxy-6-metoxy-1,4-benzoquinol methylase
MIGDALSQALSSNNEFNVGGRSNEHCERRWGEDIMIRRPKIRDGRDFDKTQLRESGHGRVLARDYSAHFWRWSFARRFIQSTHHVLEIGCGEDRPLSKILTGGAAPHVNTYVGVDLNKLKTSESQRLTFIGQFNFIQRWKELRDLRPKGYDVLVSMEVVEHFHSRFMPAFMKACFALTKPGGSFLLSTPCYDGKRMAANHINEMTVDTLRKHVVKAGFVPRQRFGTFIDIKHIGKTAVPGVPAQAIVDVRNALSAYYDNDAISCLFAPLYPDLARNNLWVLQRPS